MSAVSMPKVKRTLRNPTTTIAIATTPKSCGARRRARTTVLRSPRPRVTTARPPSRWCRGQRCRAVKAMVTEGALFGRGSHQLSAFLNGTIGSVIYSGELLHHNNTVANFL